MCEGIVGEWQGVDLGDQRLNTRTEKIIAARAANPEASINAACDGVNDTLAAYRLFDNDSVTPEQILQPHRETRLRRMREQPVVLVVQDTTELDDTKHPTNDARCLNSELRFGLDEHVSLAVTPDKLCLGVVGSEFHDRAPETLGKTLERRTLPIEEKKCYRWLKGYRRACELAAECPDTQIIDIADRECDIDDVFVNAQLQTGPKAEYISRAQEDRSTLEPNPEVGPKASHTVRDEVARSALRGTRIIELSAAPKRAARKAHLEIRSLTVQVKPPHARSHLPSVTHNVVLVEEVCGPDEGTAVSWLLITTLPIETLENLLDVIDYEVSRWTVEIYYRTVKTGCQVEQIQLEIHHRRKNCLAYYNVIAWRILSLTYLNRTVPTLPGPAVFAEAEWKSVWRVVTQTPLPPKPPVLSEFRRLLTPLGGDNNRAKEAPASPQPIWTGLRRMTDFATAWLAFGPERGSCVSRTGARPPANVFHPSGMEETRRRTTWGRQ